MSKNEDGGSAFPVDPALLRPSVSLGDDIEQRRAAKGMSLRDYFAAKALPACISLAQHHDGGWDDVAVAVSAYAVADAMIEARKR